MEQHIVITGVSHGIGYALASQFCQQGYTVHGCARHTGDAEGLKGAHGPRFTFAELDIQNPQQVDTWANSLPDPLFLLNSAAIMSRVAPITDISNEEIADVFATNVLGTCHCIKAFLPKMRKQGGVIVNFTAGWGQKGMGKFAPYSASKFAIEGLTQSIAQEMPPGLAIVAFDPGGAVQTPLLQQNIPAAYPKAAPLTTWAEKAATRILDLGPEQNGQRITP